VSWVVSSLAAASAFADDDPVELLQAQSEIPEESLLDVGIQLFDPGLPDDEYERYILEEQGIFADVRKAESRYIPLRLKQTLETSGFWGAVRLVPSSHVIDLRVAGAIRKSNGKHLEVDIRAVDATGREWLSRRYEAEANEMAYKGKVTGREPFQDLYNEIANDLTEVGQKRGDEDRLEIRRISQLRFASYLAPAAFEDYLEVKKDKYEIDRLPSYEDPMMIRLSGIRERDFMFVDTLNEYYADFGVKMSEPYNSWRSISYDEQNALDELNKTKNIERIAGIAAIVGGVIMNQKGGRMGRGAGQVAILGGMVAIQDSFQKAQEAEMNREALRELAGSFDSEVAPILIDVEGEVLRLTGSVETQYTTWRQLLRQIFAAETGLPLDPNEAPIPASEDVSKN
jgi:hypothetical protein